MMTEHKNVIGQSRAFDGAILYLPIKITEKVSDAILCGSTFVHTCNWFTEATSVLLSVGTEADS